ncbi:MAG: hypothetical protein ACT4PN_15600 [Nitrospiraceae bacterium]
MTTTPPKQPKKRDYKQHQLHTLKQALALVGSIDEWPPELMEVAEALRAKRGRMIQEQGGESVITEVERDAIDAKLQTTVLRGWVWNYVKGMGCPINRVKRKPFQVVENFISLVRAESEAGERLNTLREKRPKPEPLSLNDYLTNGKAKPLAPAASSAPPAHGTTETADKAGEA